MKSELLSEYWRNHVGRSCIGEYNAENHCKSSIFKRESVVYMTIRQSEIPAYVLLTVVADISTLNAVVMIVRAPRADQ